MKTEKHAYEFLVRWDRDGRLSGAHAQFRYVTRDEDGAVLGEFIGAAEPVAVAGADGFPLSDILDQTLTAALAECNAMAVQLAEVTAERDALRAEAERQAGT